jgi:hypothetical protein
VDASDCHGALLLLLPACCCEPTLNPYPHRFHSTLGDLLAELETCCENVPFPAEAAFSQQVFSWASRTPSVA